jgi:hypothetical protein
LACDSRPGSSNEGQPANRHLLDSPPQGRTVRTLQTVSIYEDICRAMTVAWSDRGLGRAGRRGRATAWDQRACRCAQRSDIAFPGETARISGLTLGEMPEEKRPDIRPQLREFLAWYEEVLVRIQSGAIVAPGELERLTEEASAVAHLLDLLDSTADEPAS